MKVLQLLTCAILSICVFPNTEAFVLSNQRSSGILSGKMWASTISRSIDYEQVDTDNGQNPQRKEDQIDSKPSIVLVAGFESFNTKLYGNAAQGNDVDLSVFADKDIRGEKSDVFEKAISNADCIILSLIFDYDDVMKIVTLLEKYDEQIKCRLVFESATEIMKYNRLGTFSMHSSNDGETLTSTYSEKEMATDEIDIPTSGPPPAVKAILSKFSSGKEEDKLQGYLQLLKSGPDLLKYFPGDKVADLKSWLEVYRYWQQGGASNVSSMIQLLRNRYLSKNPALKDISLPAIDVTPDIGLIHPLYEGKPFTSPSDYLKWRLGANFYELAQKNGFVVANSNAPVVAVLLYRKHVITDQPYIKLLLQIMESQDLIPIPIFINGVEAHTIVRDLLTSKEEIEAVNAGRFRYEDSFERENSVAVDAIVSTIGFPLVGGPAGSMQAGRNIEVAKDLLTKMNVPYFIAAPLLLQDIKSWRTQGVQGLQSVVLYSLPELDGAIDTTVLGGLVGDVIALVPERARKLCSRIKGWIKLRKTNTSKRRVAISIYGFPPNVGAVGTAALLDVPRSLENLLKRLAKEGYDVGDFPMDPFATGESIVAALAIMSQDVVIAQGAERMQEALNNRIMRAMEGDSTVAKSLSAPRGGLGGAVVKAFDISNDELDLVLGKYMAKKVERAWGSERGPSVSTKGKLVVAGLQLGNVWITVQPLLGVEGDPMRMLFERDLTPHRQYCASYEWMRKNIEEGGIGAQAVIHLGMHGTVEWLPGLPLGNDRRSWSDELLGSLPNIYVYAANNPSESILAKRRGYGTLVSYNVPPYGRAGLYLELANLKELTTEYRNSDKTTKQDLRESILSISNKVGITTDIPLLQQSEGAMINDVDVTTISQDLFDSWVVQMSDYLVVLQDRLFSSGLHVLGSSPSVEHLKSYLEAYFGEKLTEDEILSLIDKTIKMNAKTNIFDPVWEWFQNIVGLHQKTSNKSIFQEAESISKLLMKSTEELDSVINLLNGGYILPLPGGDLLRDGTSVLPTGRNIHALDPYRMPSAGAWAKGQRAVDKILEQHQTSSGGAYPETVAVTLWGLDTIKTRGESIAILLALVGAEPVKEGTGRIVRFDLRSLQDLGRPRIDILASMSGIFRDSFANIVDLLDDLFERAAEADEPIGMNFIKKHACELKADGVERPAARLFSNPPGDYGSMVNEVVGSGEWENEQSLGETWRGRNVFSYGRGEGGVGRARPEVLDKLLASTERIVQEIDSVEYGLTDIQEYYANTGALKKAAENRKRKSSKLKGKVPVSIIEAFGNSVTAPVQDLDQVLRIEYRSKLLNPKWRDAMVAQGSGGAYEVSQRMTAMVGWAATAKVDNFVFDQAAERYALDEAIADKLRSSNPEAFKNVIRRLLEAEGRGYWETNEEILQKLRDLYSDADDMVEQIQF